MNVGKYWPALDGLRGLAILLVVACHTGYAPVSAGAMGVTTFFVLSGFLITNVLLGRQSGLRTFYGARAVRLLPSLVLTLLGVAVIWLAQGRPLAPIAEQVATTLFYVENFFTVRHGASVLTHAWSLSVEEQFYLLWPFLLPLVLRVRRTALLLWSLIAAGIVVRAIALKTLHPFHAYASLPTNAYAFLMGALLSIVVWRLRARLLVLVVGFAAVVFASVASPFLPGGLIAAAPCAAFGAMLLVHAGRHRSVILELAPLRFVGRISYAWYLWHWPLLWLAGTQYTRLDAIPMVLLSFVIAIASTLWVEEPLRRKWRARTQRRLFPDGVIGEEPVHAAQFLETPAVVDRPQPAS